MEKVIYKTISHEEMKRIESLKVQSLQRYQGLFHRIVDGRNANIEFFEIENEITPDFEFTDDFRATIIQEKIFFEERLEAVTEVLNRRGFRNISGTNEPLKINFTEKKVYRTISPEEIERIRNVKVQSLHHYQGLFSRIVDGRCADLEFYENQTEILPYFELPYELRAKIIHERNVFAERLEAVTAELNRRGFNKFSGIN
jgi:hypothetical protein